MRYKLRDRGMEMAAAICGHFFLSFRPGRVARRRKAFSLAELLLVVAFLGIFAAIAVPRLNYAVVNKSRAEAFARKIVTDMRRARALAISDAAVNADGFGLYMSGSSPYSGYEIRNLLTGASIDSHDIDSNVQCTGGNEFRFGPLGNLLSGSDSELKVSASGRTFTVAVTAATGMIKCTSD